MVCSFWFLLLTLLLCISPSSWFSRWARIFVLEFSILCFWLLAFCLWDSVFRVVSSIPTQENWDFHHGSIVPLVQDLLTSWTSRIWCSVLDFGFGFEIWMGGDRMRFSTGCKFGCKCDFSWENSDIKIWRFWIPSTCGFRLDDDWYLMHVRHEVMRLVLFSECALCYLDSISNS